MNENKFIDIPGTLHSTAKGNIAVNSDEVFDKLKNKKQQEINAEFEHYAYAIHQENEELKEALENLNPDQTEAIALSAKVNTIDNSLSEINVNRLVNRETPFDTQNQARLAVINDFRKLELKITYLLKVDENNSTLITEQFIGNDVTNWGVADNWKTIGPVTVTQNTETNDATLQIGTDSYNVTGGDKLIELVGISYDRPENIQIGEYYYSTHYSIIYQIISEDPGYRRVAFYQGAIYKCEGTLYIAEKPNEHGQAALIEIGKSDWLIELKGYGTTRPADIELGECYYNTEYNRIYKIRDGEPDYIALPKYKGALYTYNNQIYSYKEDGRLLPLGRTVVNLQNYYNTIEYYISKANARNAVHIESGIRHEGLILVYKLQVNSEIHETTWITEQYIGSVADISSENWASDSNWQSIGIEDGDNTATMNSNNLLKSKGGYAIEQECQNESARVTLESGTITGGVDKPNPARARFAGFLKDCLFKVPSGYILLGYALYDKQDSDFIYRSWVGIDDETKSLYDNLLFGSLDGSYNRAIFKKSDNTDFTQEDLNNLGIYINTVSNIHRTDLSVEHLSKYTRIPAIDWLNAYINPSYIVTNSQQSLAGLIELQPGETLMFETLSDYNPTYLVFTEKPEFAIGSDLSNYNCAYQRLVAQTFIVSHFEYSTQQHCYVAISVSKTYYRIVIKSAPIIESSVERRNITNFSETDHFIQKYAINSNNVWQLSGRAINPVATCTKVFRNSVATIKANSSNYAIYALLHSFDNFNAMPDFVDWNKTRHTIAAGTQETIKIYEDCYLYLLLTDSNNNYYFPESVTIYPNFDEIYSKLLDRTGLTLFKNISLGDFTDYLRKGISSDNVWRLQGVKLPSSAVLKVSAGIKIKITANANFYAIIAFIHDYAGDVQDAPVSFANGTSGRTTIAKNTTQEFLVNEDCYFYVYIQADSGDFYYPASIQTFGETEVINGKQQITKNSINLIEDLHLLTGIDPNGNYVLESDSSATDMIPIISYAASKWYDKARFVNCCCYFNGAYQHYASKLAFFDNTKHLISISSGVNAAVELPTNAAFVIATYPSSSTNHFLEFSNQSILKSYFKFNKQNLVALTEPIFEKIHNVPGSVSHMIDIALDYIPFTYLGMGYGDIATAFDDVVEPVESELPVTSPQHYDGEKLQMNCSTFVMLVLRGIALACSRYENPDGVNVGDGYVLDELAEYNYFYTKAPYQYIFGGNYGKMYANKLAKYAFDRGLLYIVKPDYSNIEAGDVLFNGNNIDADFFMNIGHTFFANDVELDKNGNKIVTVMETAGKAHVMNSGFDVMWGARFPLPVRHINFVDIIGNFVPISTTVNLQADTDYVIGTLNLSEYITPKNQYTLAVECDLDADINVGITIGTKRILIDRRHIYLTKDGASKKRFCVYQDENINVNEINLFVNASESGSNVPITITKVELSHGWHI